MRYAELESTARLAECIQCIWTFEDEANDAELQRIVPDGRAELIVHFGAPFREVTDRGDVIQPRVLFAGQLTRPLWLRGAGGSGVIGVRFRPAGARRFLGMPLVEATDRRIALGELWPAPVRAFLHAIAAANDSAARVAAAEAFVAERMESNAGDDPVVSRCVATMERAAGLVTVEQLALEAGVGRRQLERRFRDVVGVSPALLANIFRFRRVFDAIEADSARPWTDAALAAGYFDQSHLIRDFRRFVGCTPTQFAASGPGLATALVEG